MRTLTLLAITLAALPLMAQAPASRKSATTSRPAAAKTTTPPTAARPARNSSGLPVGAVQVDEFTWRAKDEKGVAWIYRKNPFGFSKVREDEANKPVVPLAVAADVRVTETADGKYKFERTGPWGTQVWTKAKGDLSQEEKQWASKGQEAAKQ